MLREEQGKALLLELPEGLRKLPRPGGIEVAVGSSHTKAFGFMAYTDAMAARCFSPLERASTALSFKRDSCNALWLHPSSPVSPGRTDRNSRRERPPLRQARRKRTGFWGPEKRFPPSVRSPTWKARICPCVYPHASAENSGIVGRRKPVDKPCHGGLAAAGEPCQHDAFAAFYRKGNVLYASVRVSYWKEAACKLDHAMLLYQNQ